MFRKRRENHILLSFFFFFFDQPIAINVAPNHDFIAFFPLEKLPTASGASNEV